MEQIKLYPQEEFKEIILPYSLTLRYGVSNYGRVVSFTDNVLNGRVLKLSDQGDGFLVWRIKAEGKTKGFLAHRLVAQYFLPPPAADKPLVIHKDYNKRNNRPDNLEYMGVLEQRQRSNKTPASQRAFAKLQLLNRTKQKGMKLTATQVQHIKKLINNPDRRTRIKMIAKQFKVSEMQIYRIKSGELWSHITV